MKIRAELPNKYALISGRWSNNQTRCIAIYIAYPVENQKKYEYRISRFFPSDNVEIRCTSPHLQYFKKVLDSFC